MSLADLLNPTKALIFRITHRENVAWILENGLFCPSSEVSDPNFISIGNAELIQKRRTRAVPISPGGVLEDYVPFYFTPFSPMLLNIHTGYGVKQRDNQEIAILVSSLPNLEKHGIDYVYTDRHAYLQTATFYNEIEHLTDAVDYPLLRTKDFTRDAEHPEKFDRYQAEALAHHCVPTEALLGIACYTSEIKEEFDRICSDRGADVKILLRTGWYF